MTIPEILRAIAPYKPMARVTLYTHLKHLRIKAIGVRQIPARYPDDTPDKILCRLGLKKRNGNQRRAA